jgi:hypothetical protein
MTGVKQTIKRCSLTLNWIDTAIDQKLRVAYDYNKIGIDKKLHKSSYQVVSPYQLILHISGIISWHTASIWAIWYSIDLIE